MSLKDDEVAEGCAGCLVLIFYGTCLSILVGVAVWVWKAVL